MPILSMFFGIIIRMYRAINGPHHIPHIHAEYQGQELVIPLDGEISEGSLPSKKTKLVLAWIEIHHEELVANWQLLSEGEEYFKIDPLR